MEASDLEQLLREKHSAFVEPFASYNLALPFSERRIVLVLIDILALVFASVLAIWSHSLLRGVYPPHLFADTRPILWLIVLGCVWLMFGAVNEAYDLRVAAEPARVVRSLLFTTIESGLAYLFIFFFFGRPAVLVGAESSRVSTLVGVPLPPRIVPVFFLGGAFVCVSVWRLVYARLFTSQLLRRRALVVGAGSAGRTLVEMLRENLQGYEVVGFIDDDPDKQSKHIVGLPILGNRYDLPTLAQRIGANEIVLAITHEMHNELFQALMKCYEQGITIKPMPLLYEETLGQIPVEHLGQKWFPPPLWNTGYTPTFYRVTKRILDILAAVLGLTVFAPIILFLALIIYLDSPGPPLYTQERLGRRGKPFRLIKLRSMIPNAEQHGEAVWAQENDARITRVGMFLRRTRLDEVPQLWNVLKGEMSIVGPRPERSQFVEQLQEEIPFYRARLSVKPGLTGWAQIKYRYGATINDARIKLQYDLFYIKNRSIVLDLLIMLRTIKVMLTFKGR